jgi:Ca-activated chloride channel family protein
MRGRFLPSMYPALSGLGGSHLELKMWLMILLTAMVLNCCHEICFAGGTLYTYPPKVNEESVPVARPTCLVSKTMVTVSESSVEVKIDQVFVNDNDYDVEGIFLCPMMFPEPHRVSEVLVNGAKVGFDVLNPAELFPLLRKITLDMEDPAPLALVGYQAVVCPRIKLNMRESKSFRIVYSLPLGLDNDILDLKVPMSGERFALAPVGDYEIIVRFKMSRQVRTSISTSNNVRIENEAPGRRLVVCQEKGIRDPEDFRLLTTFSGLDLNLRLFFHRIPDKMGYFMALIEPPFSKQSGAAPLNDIVMLLDCSSSMNSRYMAEGKKALLLLIQKLRPRDRFEVIRFTSRQKKLFGSLAPAQNHNVAVAADFVEASKSDGGTDLFNTMLSAFHVFTTKKREKTILLVTDGKATVGKTNPEALIDVVRRYNKLKIRVFVVALGPSPDLATLDQIAKVTGGSILQVSVSEAFEPTVSKWLDGIISPQATEVSLNLKDLGSESVVPEPVPDVIGSESLSIFGRYVKSPGKKVSVTLKGKVSGKVAEVVKKLEPPIMEKSNNFIPGLWAMRRMASLLDLERTRGQNQSLKDQIRKLGQEFGLLIYNTSPKFEKASSDLLWKYKTSFVISEVTRPGFRRIGERLFKNEGAYWVESGSRGSEPEEEVNFLSDRYFNLVAEDYEKGPIMAMGPEVSFMNNGTFFRVTRSPDRSDKVKNEPPTIN